MPRPDRQIAEARAAPARLGPAEPFQKELDRLRKGIADSQAPKAPEPANGPKK